MLHPGGQGVERSNNTTAGLRRRKEAGRLRSFSAGDGSFNLRGDFVRLYAWFASPLFHDLFEPAGADEDTGGGVKIDASTHDLEIFRLSPPPPAA